MYRHIRWPVASGIFFLGLIHHLPAQGSWQEIPVFESREGARMEYDPTHQRVFLFGGLFLGNLDYPDDTWEWQGTRWKERPVQVRPRGRIGAALSYAETPRKGLLLYGGLTTDPKGPGGVNFVNDTWHWNGRSWIRLRPKFSPTPSRRGMSMTDDPKRRRMVLFGGNRSLGSLSALDDTWEFDGQNWIQRFPKHKPSRRALAAMAYNPKTSRVMVFGGASRYDRAEADTWEWDGEDWTKIAGAVTGLGARNASTMLYIPWKNTMYLVGGWEARSGKWLPRTDLWEWTGKTWKAVPNSRVPVQSLRNDAVAIPETKTIVTIGGSYNPRTAYTQNDTWSWDGKTWTKVDSGTLLERTWWQASYMADPPRDQILAVVAPEAGQPARHPLETWALPASGRWKQLKPKTSPPGYKYNSTNWLPRMVRHDALGIMVMSLRTTQGFETWLWDGRDWRKDKSPSMPQSNRLCYDSRRKKVIAMEYVSGTIRNMWAWDAKGWVKTHSLVKTPDLNDGADDWAYDPIRDRIVTCYSPGTSGKTYLTSEWDGKRWTIYAQGCGKVAGGKLFFHPGLGGVVACGGLDNANYPGLILPNINSWLWNGKTWKKLIGPKLPSPRNNWLMQAFYDPGRQRGIAAFPVPVPSQLWEFRLDTLKASQPYPHPGEAFTMDVQMPAQAGNPFLLMFAGTTRPGIPLRKVTGVGTELLPLTPDPLFWLSLQLGLIAGLDKQGKASLPLRFPNDPRLLWLDLHMAGVTFDKTGIAAISDQVPIRIVK